MILAVLEKNAYEDNRGVCALASFACFRLCFDGVEMGEQGKFMHSDSKLLQIDTFMFPDVPRNLCIIELTKYLLKVCLH